MHSVFYIIGEIENGRNEDLHNRGGEENLNSSSLCRERELSPAILLDDTSWLLDRNYETWADNADIEYTFDGVYGPIPNEDGTVDLTYYARDHIANYQNITELPEGNKKYLDEVLTIGKYKVVNMTYMFNNCNSLTSLDISNWNTSNVSSMYGMIKYCDSLTSLDVSNWDTSNVTDMGYMFSNCNSLTTVIGTIDMSKVSNYSYMLQNTSKLQSINIKLPSSISQSSFLRTSRVTNTSAVHFV